VATLILDRPAVIDIARREVAGIQAENPQVQHRALALARRHLQRMAPVGDHLLGIELHAPRREQGPGMRRLVGRHGGHRILRVGPGLIGIRQRVHEHRDVSAAQGVLIDRKLHRRRQVLRMRDHQQVDVRIDLAGGRIDGPYIEQLLRLAVDGPRLAHLAGLLIESGRHRQARQPADHRLPGARQL